MVFFLQLVKVPTVGTPMSVVDHYTTLLNQYQACVAVDSTMAEFVLKGYDESKQLLQVHLHLISMYKYIMYCFEDTLLHALLHAYVCLLQDTQYFNVRRRPIQPANDSYQWLYTCSCSPHTEDLVWAMSTELHTTSKGIHNIEHAVLHTAPSSFCTAC